MYSVQKQSTCGNMPCTYRTNKTKRKKTRINYLIAIKLHNNIEIVYQIIFDCRMFNTSKNVDWFVLSKNDAIPWNFSKWQINQFRPRHVYDFPCRLLADAKHWIKRCTLRIYPNQTNSSNQVLFARRITSTRCAVCSLGQAKFCGWLNGVDAIGRILYLRHTICKLQTQRFNFVIVLEMWINRKANNEMKRSPRGSNGLRGLI